MMDTNLDKLAERVEGATAEQQREMLEAAFSAIYPGLRLPAPGAYWPPMLTRFVKMLDAEAYESAAMMLVPEGWYWRVGHSTLYEGWANVHSKHPDFCDRDDEHFAKAATPALALTAACLRARAQVPQGER